MVWVTELISELPDLMPIRIWISHLIFRSQNRWNLILIHVNVILALVNWTLLWYILSISFTFWSKDIGTMMYLTWIISLIILISMKFICDVDADIASGKLTKNHNLNRIVFDKLFVVKRRCMLMCASECAHDWCIAYIYVNGSCILCRFCPRTNSVPKYVKSIFVPYTKVKTSAANYTGKKTDGKLKYTWIWILYS